MWKGTQRMRVVVLKYARACGELPEPLNFDRDVVKLR